ncbi:MAG: hypothetical protein KGL53_06580, partial [Elusimicrobia bacterium]|nr:hypothetical protein [Elusimicrobiota bacterium]
EARFYEAYKRELAHRFHHDRSRYTAAKGGFINAALERAWRWKRAPLVVYDLEATCWEQGTVVERQEVIEIGAVRLDSDLRAVAEFQRMVRPVKEPVLSDFCRRLTNIAQEEVDAAGTFPGALEEFRAWGGEPPVRWASWGAYDLRQLKSDCSRHGLDLPASMECHVDLRALFAEQRDLPPGTMTRALELVGIPQRGRHHRGLEDSRNIAHLVPHILGSK